MVADGKIQWSNAYLYMVNIGYLINETIKFPRGTSHTLAFDILFARLKINLIEIPNLKMGYEIITHTIHSCSSIPIAWYGN